jgi:kanamycin kinase
VIARVPPADVDVPPRVAALADGGDIRPVWCNELGGLTFEIATPSARHFVKWAPAGNAEDFTDEIARLRWASAFIQVPTVLQTGRDDTGSWLMTAALPGESAVSPRWLSEPHTAATAIGRGLRRLHDTLPVTSCPFFWSADARLAQILSGGARNPDQWHPEHASLTMAAALARLRRPPPVDQLVVCHGDPCAPNTLIDDSGSCSGHVDLGQLGTADRWADLAVATWSLDWNYGPGWQHVLLDAYGVAPDQERVSYYRLLWDLSP